MTNPILERKALLEQFDNDADFLNEIVRVFRDDCPRMLAAIQAGVAARDPIQLMNASHALKGAVSVFGATNAIAAAQDLESIGRQATMERAAGAFSVLERELALVGPALEEIARGTAL
jgi:HPt (histidine-containing phosphotransfer) domain-containing protein